MNCVLIIVDSWRQDHCGCYGNEWIATPHLDALAAESDLTRNVAADARGGIPDWLRDCPRSPGCTPILGDDALSGGPEAASS